ncbi:MAG: tripartite tricarboxylate transporter TctB family protein [Rhodospirillales bacterium]
MNRINADVVIALLLLTISTVLFVDTFFYETVPGAIIGAKIWPRVVTIFLGSLSFLYLVQSLRGSHPAPTEEEAAGGLSGWLRLNRNVVGCFMLYGIFLFSLKWLGMLLGGIAFVFATLSFLGESNRRSYIINGVVAVVTIGCMWALFQFGLGVILPQGEILPR